MHTHTLYIYIYYILYIIYYIYYILYILYFILYIIYFYIIYYELYIIYFLLCIIYYILYIIYHIYIYIILFIIYYILYILYFILYLILYKILYIYGYYTLFTLHVTVCCETILYSIDKSAGLLWYTHWEISIYGDFTMSFRRRHQLVLVPWAEDRLKPPTDKEAYSTVNASLQQRRSLARVAATSPETVQLFWAPQDI